MGILIGNYEFDGPVTGIGEIPAAPGLYAVLHEQGQELLLVDLDQSNDLFRSLVYAADELPQKIVVLLRCENTIERRKILQELLHEFEFEDDEPMQNATAGRTETKDGVALTI